jgi:hypothetical protein
MGMLLKLKLQRITFDQDLEIIVAAKTRKWFDIRDEALGILLLSF